jgi:hypothetical protein
MSSFAIEYRLRFVDFLLAQYGTVNRSALVDYFGISVVQASNDFALYMRIAPRNMVYDMSSKTYQRTPKFKRLYP